MELNGAYSPQQEDRNDDPTSSIMYQPPVDLGHTYKIISQREESSDDPASSMIS